MRADPPTVHPLRPPSEVEWEDLLYRLELMVRALRVTLEDAPAEDAALAEALRDALAEEVRAHAWLMERAVGEPLEEAERARLLGGAAGRGEVRPLAERFARLRLRNFAILQRRGIEVWEWAGELEGAGEVSVYQLMTARRRGDAELLARLRAGLRGERVGC